MRMVTSFSKLLLFRVQFVHTVNHSKFQYFATVQIQRQQKSDVIEITQNLHQLFLLRICNKQDEISYISCADIRQVHNTNLYMCLYLILYLHRRISQKPRFCAFISDFLRE